MRMSCDETNSCMTATKKRWWRQDPRLAQNQCAMSISLELNLLQRSPPSFASAHMQEHSVAHDHPSRHRKNANNVNSPPSLSLSLQDPLSPQLPTLTPISTPHSPDTKATPRRALRNDKPTFPPMQTQREDDPPAIPSSLKHTQSSSHSITHSPASPACAILSRCHHHPPTERIMTASKFRSDEEYSNPVETLPRTTTTSNTTHSKHTPCSLSPCTG